MSRLNASLIWIFSMKTELPARWDKELDYQSSEFFLFPNVPFKMQFCDSTVLVQRGRSRRFLPLQLVSDLGEHGTGASAGEHFKVLPPWLFISVSLTRFLNSLLPPPFPCVSPALRDTHGHTISCWLCSRGPWMCWYLRSQEAQACFATSPSIQGSPPQPWLHLLGSKELSGAWFLCYSTDAYWVPTVNRE